MNIRKGFLLLLALMLVLPFALGMYDTKALAAEGNVKVEAVGESQLNLSWDAYKGATLYIIFYTNVEGNYSKYTFAYSNNIEMTNLEKNTQYWFRIVPNSNATVSYYATGTTAGAVQAPTPTTPTTPTAPAGNPTLNEAFGLEMEILSYTEIKLTWNELEGYEEYYVWKYGESGYELVDMLEKVKWEDEDLEPGTTYRYMISTPDNAYYMEVEGTTMSYPGAGCDEEYPVIKIWQRAEGAYTRLTWNDVGASEYYVLRSTEPDTFDWIEDRIETIPAGQNLAYLDTDTSQQYYYLIVADIKTCSEFVEYALDLTVSNSTTSPYSSLVLNWTDSSNAGSYTVFRSLNGVDWSQRTITSALTYTDTGLTAGTTYYYKVEANNGLVDIDSGTTKKQDVLTLTVTNNTADPYTRLNLSWTDTSNASSYTIYRSLNNSSWYAVGTSTVRSFVDTGLNPGTKYYYRVSANTGIEGTGNGTTKKQDVLKLTVTNSTADPYTQLVLNWTDTSNATSYTIYRSLDNYNWKARAIVTKRTLTDVGLTPNTTYYYKVVASTGIEGSNWCKTKPRPATPTPKPTPTPTPTPSVTAPTNAKAWNMHCQHYRVFAKWDAVKGATRYELQYQRRAMTSTSSFGAWATYSYPTEAPAKPYGSYDIYISNGYFYQFRIRAQASNGTWSDWSNIMGPTSIIPGYCSGCGRVY